MATLIRMPEVLANATEAVLSVWEVPEGATVAVGDVLAEIETEKAVVQYAAEEAGVLARHLAAPGQAVDVGAPIALLLASADEPVDLAALLGEAQAPDGEPRPAATANGHPAAPPNGQPAGDGPRAARLFASPLARKLAKDAGLDLTPLTGTGPGGRIVRRDVQAQLATLAAPGRVGTPALADPAPARPAAPPAAPAPTADDALDIPHTPMRRAIARRLTESKSTVPHFYLVAECRVDELLDLRRRVNATGTVKASLNDLVLRAVAAAYRAVPEANVQWTDGALRQFSGVDVAMAVATDGGLTTPVVRGVDRMPVSEVARATADLAARARAGRLRQDELEGGSLTVSNLGMHGTLEFSAILNPPQSAILAVGAALPSPVVEDGQVVVGTVMRVTLSADHRAIDGALAARWLRAFQEAVEHPVLLLV